MHRMHLMPPMHRTHPMHRTPRMRRTRLIPRILHMRPEQYDDVAERRRI
jgi:hypothetical protein